MKVAPLAFAKWLYFSANCAAEWFQRSAHCYSGFGPIPALWVVCRKEIVMSENKTMSFNDLEQWLNERRVTEVECLVPDLTGVARGKILPRGKFTEDRGMRLPQAIVAMGVTGEFPESGPYYDCLLYTSPSPRD